ncbi:hypothetical protein VP01_289g2 [Puccinia sorghi]|uniref:Uncharacterized protein n=1 Tax=Puccinia sorghi TaxID=27349 RepID=A0A0L6V3D1_9BASI|nr:hypothetical protein VP01_289g2 [Puccinia sorghi]
MTQSGLPLKRFPRLSSNTGKNTRALPSEEILRCLSFLVGVLKTSCSNHSVFETLAFMSRSGVAFFPVASLARQTLSEWLEVVPPRIKDFLEDVLSRLSRQTVGCPLDYTFVVCQDKHFHQRGVLHNMPGQLQSKEDSHGLALLDLFRGKPPPPTLPRLFTCRCGPQRHPVAAGQLCIACYVTRSDSLHNTATVTQSWILFSTQACQPSVRTLPNNQPITQLYGPPQLGITRQTQACDLGFWLILLPPPALSTPAMKETRGRCEQWWMIESGGAEIKNNPKCCEWWIGVVLAWIRRSMIYNKQRLMSKFILLAAVCLKIFILHQKLGLLCDRDKYQRSMQSFINLNVINYDTTSSSGWAGKKQHSKESLNKDDSRKDITRGPFVALAWHVPSQRCSHSLGCRVLDVGCIRPVCMS